MASRPARWGMKPGCAPSAAGQHCRAPSRGIFQKVYGSYGNGWKGGQQAVASEGEILFVFAALEVVRDAVDVIQSVERRAGTAHTDEAARFQGTTVTQHIERAGAAHAVGGLRGLRQPDHRAANRAVFRSVGDRVNVFRNRRNRSEKSRVGTIC